MALLVEDRVDFADNSHKMFVGRFRFSFEDDALMAVRQRLVSRRLAAPPSCHPDPLPSAPLLRCPTVPLPHCLASLHLFPSVSGSLGQRVASGSEDLTWVCEPLGRALEGALVATLDGTIVFTAPARAGVRLEAAPLRYACNNRTPPTPRETRVVLSQM